MKAKRKRKSSSIIALRKATEGSNKAKDTSKVADDKSRVMHRGQGTDSVLFLVPGVVLSVLALILENIYLGTAENELLADYSVRPEVDLTLLSTGDASVIGGFIASMAVVFAVRSAHPALAIFPLVITAIELFAKGSVISTLYGYSGYETDSATQPYLLMTATFFAIWLLISLPTLIASPLDLDAPVVTETRLWRVSMRVYIAGSWVFSLYVLVPWVCDLKPQEFSQSLLDGDVLSIAIVALSAVGFATVRGSIVAMFVNSHLVVKSHKKG